MNTKQPPWYRQHALWTTRALAYLTAHRELADDFAGRHQINGYREFSLARKVFESNCLERAGLPLGETRKLVESLFPRIPGTQAAFVAAGGHPDKIGALAGHILRSARWADENLGLYLSQLQQKPAELLFTVDFAGDKRGFQEVMQHATAVHEAWGLALEYACELIRCEQEEAFARLREDEKAALVRALEEIKGCPQESWFSGQRRRQLLNEADVQRLHFMLAEDLLSEDCLVQPGQYRVDNRVVGFDVMFPSPDLVPECMARYVESSNELARQLRARPEIAIRVAARVSYDFVRIHPFPDFNGRLSRILLEMVLVQADCPFHVSLRADKIGRARYLKALTSANRGDLRPYETLIAMSVVDGFRNIDENLRAAGLPPLVAVGEGDD